MKELFCGYSDEHRKKLLRQTDVVELLSSVMREKLSKFNFIRKIKVVENTSSITNDNY